MFKYLRKAIILTLIVAFIGSSLSIPQAQAGEMVVPYMPVPGTMVHLSPEYTPAHLQGLTIHPDNALQFDFLIHRGDGELDSDQKRQEYTKLTKYFLASLTVPDEDQWVNLSPYEHNRIIKDDFGKTEMGRDLLTQDYLLKQITSSLMYPESSLGRSFWDRVYERAYKEFGSTSIPVNTFNKVWIVPDQADVYESGNTVFILRSHLKVMLEEDYLSLKKHHVANNTHTITSKIVKEIILPELEREVNEDKNFSLLRQIYSGMILAAWYKQALKESLLGKVYADKARVKGVNVPLTLQTLTTKRIYKDYLIAFKKGVYNYIKEDEDKYTQQMIPRKYFAGGFVDNASVVLRRYSAQSPFPFNVDASQLSSIDKAQVALQTAGEIASEGQKPYNPNHVLGFEVEGQVNRALKLDDNGNYPKDAGRMYLSTIKSMLPPDWDAHFDPDRPRNFFEFTTHKNGAPDTAETWEEIERVLGALSKGPLRNGVYSIHANYSIAKVPVRNGMMQIDSNRLGRIVKVYEAMWRALAGKSWSEAGGEGYVRTLSLDNGHDVGGGVDSHGSIINMNRDHMEVKIIEGDLSEPAKLRERTAWGFDLLEFVSDMYDAGPLAVLGLPVLAGHKPTQKQIDRFLELFFAGDPQGESYARSIFSQLEHEPAGKSQAEQEQENNDIRDFYTKLGLGRIYALHEENDGYDEHVVDHFLNNVDEMNGLAADLVQANLPDKVALGYFPVEMHHALQKALDLEKKKFRPGTFKMPEFSKFNPEYLSVFTPSYLNSLEAAPRSEFWADTFIREDLQKEISLTDDYVLNILKKQPFEIILKEKMPLFKDYTDAFLLDSNFNNKNDIAKGLALALDNINLNVMIEQRVIDKLIKIRRRQRLAGIALAMWMLFAVPDTTKIKGREERPAFIRPVDQAMSVDRAMKGGIDLNAANLNLKIKRDGNGVPLPLLEQDWAKLNQIQGFVPVIIEISPVTTLPILSEIQNKLQTA